MIHVYYYTIMFAPTNTVEKVSQKIQRAEEIDKETLEREKINALHFI